MNERIKELARQAGATDEYGHKATDVFCFTGSELDGFAKLIVRECMNAVCDPQDMMYRSMTESSALYAARESIIKHFGVK